MLGKFDEFPRFSLVTSSRDLVAHYMKKVSGLEKMIIEKRDTCLETEVSCSCLPPGSYVSGHKVG